MSKITYETAKAFFEALDDNEKSMGECAALSVTLSEFGYDDDQLDVLGTMAEAFERGPEKKGTSK